MAKRKTRRPTGQGGYWFEPKTQRHFFRYKGKTVADKDKDGAQAKFEDLKRRVDGEFDIAGSRQTLSDHLPRYINGELNIKDSTRHDYHKRADYYILPTLGDFRLCDLKYRIGKAWLDAMLNDTDWSLNSVRQAVRLVQRALDNAVTAGLLEENPFAGLKLPTRRRGDEHKIEEEEEQARTFTPAQVAALLAEVQRTNAYHGLYLLYVLAIRLGLRRGELLGLRWKDIDFAARVLRVRQQVIRLDNAYMVTQPKTQSARRDLPLPDDMVTMLREYKLSLGERGRTYVFPSDAGEFRRPDGIDQHFSRVCKRLGFEGFVFHSLRKTATTEMRRDGVDLEVAAAILGHKGVKVTAETYSDATMERKRAAVERKRGEG
jgi:integrase